MAEPPEWHCGSCTHPVTHPAQDAPRAGVRRRTFLHVAGTAAALGAVAPRAFADGDQRAARPLTTAAGAGDALASGTWLAGDTHVHSDHSSDGSATRQGSGQVLPGNVAVSDQIAQAERMGLQFLPITDHRTYDQHWDPLWTSGSLLLIPGEEANGSPHATVHGCIDEVVDGAAVPGSHSYRHLQQSIWEVAAQGGAWSTAHPDTGEYDPVSSTSNARRTNDNAEAVGVHLVEVWNRGSEVDTEIDYAEDRWNAGWRFGGVGGCDCHFRELWGIAGPGMPTTYVLAPDRTERGVLDALRAGRTTISITPLGAFLTLEADLDGDGRYEAVGGDEVVGLAAGRPGTLRLRVQRGTGATLTVLAAPGRSAAAVFTARITSPDQTFLVPVTVPPGEHWWRAEVRADGAPASVDSDAVKAGRVGTTSVRDQIQAFVSPIFTSTAGAARPRARLPLPTQVGTDSAQLAIGAPGEFTGFADVAVGPDDVTHVVAERHLRGGTTVVYRRIHPDGGSTDERVLTPSTAARLPRIAVSGEHVHVVWQDERQGQQPRHAEVWRRSSHDGGRTWQPEQRVSRSNGRSERPAVAVDPDRPASPWVAWMDNHSLATPGPAWPTAGQDCFDVLVAHGDDEPVNVSRAGKTTSPGTPTDTRSARWPASLHPSITVRPDGGVVVVWQDDRFDPHPLWTGATPPVGSTSGGDQSLPDAWEPMVAVREPSGRWSAPGRVAPNPQASARHPQVVAAPDGRLVCVWSWKRLEAADANLGLRSATSGDGGRTWSSPTPVDPAPQAMSARPRLGIDPDGVTRVVWSDTRHADWRWRVRTSRLVGGAWTPGTDLTNVGNGTYPATAGGVVVATSDRNARPQRDITQQVVLVDLRGSRRPEGDDDREADRG